MTLAACEQLLKDSMGLDVASIGASAIERAVRHRQHACQLPDVQAYWEHLRRSQTELQELIDAVVVPETWFFRDRESFAVLARVSATNCFPRPPAGRCNCSACRARPAKSPTRSS
jgi:chemotaxis protein methyltransferase WspC